MKRNDVRFLMILGVSALMAFGTVSNVFAADTAEQIAEEAESSVLEDGIYSAKFDTDSSMFHVNESMDGRGVLTVKDGEMTIHVSLASKGILNLFVGTADDAKKDGAEVLEPTVDSVTYSDGWTEEVYGFDIPVPALDEEFDVALIGKKGKWYDHKVSVSDPQPQTEENVDGQEKETKEVVLEDGSYTVEVELKGGSGRASVESPAALTVKDKKAEIQLIWSSSSYDYMLVDEEKYEPVNTEGNSTFVIPVTEFDCEIPVIADTIAMSVPHEISYTIVIDSSSVKKAE